MITMWAAEAKWVRLKGASVSTDYPAKLVRGVLNSLSRELTTCFTESTTGARILYVATSLGSLPRLFSRDCLPCNP